MQAVWHAPKYDRLTSSSPLTRQCGSRLQATWLQGAVDEATALAGSDGAKPVEIETNALTCLLATTLYYWRSNIYSRATLKRNDIALKPTGSEFCWYTCCTAGCTDSPSFACTCSSSSVSAPAAAPPT